MISEFDRARVIVLLLLSGAMVVVATAGWIAHRRQPTATLIVVLLFVASLLISLGVLMIRYSYAEPPQARIELVPLHGLESRLVYVNAHEVTSLQEPLISKGIRHNPPGTRCLISLSGGRQIAVQETCSEVEQLLEDGK